MRKKKNVKQIVFIRHGQSEYNVKNKFYGWHDPDLTDLGRKQALELSERITKYIDPEVILCSDLKRAVNTAIPIAKKFGKKPVIYKEFREINHGDWEGMTFDEIKTEFPDEAGIWIENSKIFRYPNGENYIDTYNRAKKILDKELKKYDSLILVAHFGTIDSLLSGIFFGEPVSENGFKADNATVIKFEIIDGKAILYNFNL